MRPVRVALVILDVMRLAAIVLILGTLATAAGSTAGRSGADGSTNRAAGARSVADATDTGFALPVAAPAIVLVPFDPPANPYGPGHRGVDLAAPAGAPVSAAGAGTVVYAGILVDRGVVSVQHPGGLRTTYEPVDAVVSAGQSVTTGTLLGTLQAGHPPCAPADCLHWGARLPDGTYLDPMALLEPWQVRLKPWEGG